MALSSTEEVLSKVKSTHTHTQENQLHPYFFTSESLKETSDVGWESCVYLCQSVSPNHGPTGCSSVNCEDLKRQEEGMGGVWTFVRIIHMSHEYSALLAFPHTGFHHSSHTLTSAIRHTSMLWIISFIYLCHRIPSWDGSLACRFKSLTIYCLQLFNDACILKWHCATMKCGKWPLLSESNDKAVCIHSQ